MYVHHSSLSCDEGTHCLFIWCLCFGVLYQILWIWSEDEGRWYRKIELLSSVSAWNGDHLSLCSTGGNGRLKKNPENKKQNFKCLYFLPSNVLKYVINGITLSRKYKGCHSANFRRNSESNPEYQLKQHLCGAS